MFDLTFQSGVYILCLLTSAACALLLIRNYRRTGARLLLWSGLCFAFLALNNLIVVVDILVFPRVVDLALLRLGASLIAVSVLLYGFVWESE